ncbi:MAG: helix-turn-helix domain-containing protein [Dysgonamonadaceae bacterium]|jgi:AraC-like DNA-binding protein|nr:helix-turn-helix domain-containing protein [Dysgonamonadaceae bacterium]
MAEEFFIIPEHSDFYFNSLKDSLLLLLYIDGDMEFCKQVRNKIFEKRINRERNKIITLKMNDLLRNVVSNFLKLIDRGLLCKIYIKASVSELISLISPCFPHDMLAQFFIHLGRPDSNRLLLDSDFKFRVLQYRNKVFTVKELANLLNMNRETFRNNFIRIFGLPPKTWILNERKRLIYRELTEGKKAVKDIAELAGFATEIQLYKFSKNNFSETVYNIRKRG